MTTKFKIFDAIAIPNANFISQNQRNKNIKHLNSGVDKVDRAPVQSFFGCPTVFIISKYDKKHFFSYFVWDMLTPDTILSTKK